MTIFPLAVLLADEPAAPDGRHYLSQPLVQSIYTADPSAHVFNGKLYIYPSHDVPTDIPDDDLGSEYAMHDYRVLSMDRMGGPVKIGPVALDVKDVPWASKQLWAPDAAYRNGMYYLYFPCARQAGTFSHRRGHRERSHGTVPRRAGSHRRQLQH